VGTHDWICGAAKVTKAGVAFIQIPTTLAVAGGFLPLVGKTGNHHGLGKNMDRLSISPKPC